MTKLLIIDDDLDIVRLLEQVFQDEGYAVCSADGENALAVALAEQPQLIVLDLMIPGVDGLEVSRRLRANPQTLHIPILILSAARHLKEQAQAIQADALLAKPFNLDDLQAQIERLVARPVLT